MTSRWRCGGAPQQSEPRRSRRRRAAVSRLLRKKSAVSTQTIRLMEPAVLVDLVSACSGWFSYFQRDRRRIPNVRYRVLPVSIKLQLAALRERSVYMPDVAGEIIKIISDKTDSTNGALKISDPLDELGLDSLGVVELTFLIEEKFDVEIPLNANSDISAKTVADLVEMVESLVAAKVSMA
jgi:acyl carrier protein